MTTPPTHGAPGGVPVLMILLPMLCTMSYAWVLVVMTYYNTPRNNCEICVARSPSDSLCFSCRPALSPLWKMFRRHVPCTLTRFVLPIDRVRIFQPNLSSLPKTATPSTPCQHTATRACLGPSLFPAVSGFRIYSSGCCAAKFLGSLGNTVEELLKWKN